MVTQGPFALLPYEILVLIISQAMKLSFQHHISTSNEYKEYNKKYYDSKPEDLYVCNFDQIKGLTFTCRRIYNVVRTIIYQNVLIGMSNVNKTYALPKGSNVGHLENFYFFEHPYIKLAYIPESILQTVTFLSINTECCGFSRKKKSPVYYKVLKAICKILDLKITPNLKYLKLLVHTKEIGKRHDKFIETTRKAARALDLRHTTAPLELHLCVYDSVSITHFDDSFLKFVTFLTLYKGLRQDSNVVAIKKIPNLQEFFWDSTRKYNEIIRTLLPRNLGTNGYKSRTTICCVKSNFSCCFNIAPVLLSCYNINDAHMFNLSSLTSLYFTDSKFYSGGSCYKGKELCNLKNFGARIIHKEMFSVVKTILSDSVIRTKIERLYIEESNKKYLYIKHLAPLLLQMTNLQGAHFYQSMVYAYTKVDYNYFELFKCYTLNHPSLLFLTIPVVRDSQMAPEFDQAVNFVRHMCTKRKLLIPSDSSKCQFKLRFSHAVDTRLTRAKVLQNVPENSSVEIDSCIKSFSPFDIFGESFGISEFNCIRMDERRETFYKYMPIKLTKVVTINTQSVLKQFW